MATIAEDIYEPITSLYHHQPSQKVSFIIKDYDDISNGAAYFYDNKIELYAPSMDFELRGTHNWLRNVVTHEFTHIVQIQTSMKFGRRMPALYLQWLGYESERRPDVLYGYPNVIVSYPLSGFVVPAWFAEGVAQYNRKELRYDFWDTHRDMILRCYALDSTMLTWEQMGVFGKTSLGNESSYNAGFAFVSYLAQRYGEETLAQISRNLGTLTEVTIDGAIRRAVGKSGSEVFNEWADETRRGYMARVAQVRAHLREGELMHFGGGHEVVNPEDLQRIETMLRDRAFQPESGARSYPCCRAEASTGFANLYPVFSPDGKKLAYASAKGGDYFILSSLYVYDFTTRQETLAVPGVRSSPSWSPDGRSLYYAKSTRDNPHWSLQYDIYRFDLAEREETRITTGRRATTPAVSPDGKKIAYVVNADGTTNLAIANVDGLEENIITPYASGEQVYNPRWSPSGDRIIFDYSIKDGRDIAQIRPDGTDLRFLISGPDDSRTGTFTKDGSAILFASDRTGIFNLYYYKVDGGEIAQVTNVLGGAFCPAEDSAGTIAYSAYTSGGYKLALLRNAAPLPPGSGAYLAGSPNGTDGSVASTGPLPPAVSQFDWNRLRTYDDTNVQVPASRPYKSIFTSVSFVPFLRVDNYNTKNKALDVLKPGVYLFSNDVLEKTGFFAGAALNRQLERDLFLQFFYRSRIPILYDIGLEPVASFEVYNVTRKTDNVIALPASIIPVSVTYNLLEFDLALSQPFVSQFSSVEFRYAHSRYTSIIENFINPETDPPSLVPGSSELYLIANALSLTLKSDAVVPSSTMDINPSGRRVMLRIGRELNKFNGDGEYEITPTGLQPRYKTVNFTRVELNWREYIPLFFRNHTLNISLRGGTILEHSVDEFFDFYAGGLVGMKGYPFYSIGGNEMAVGGISYRFPIAESLDARFLQLYFDKLYASVYADAGNAWTSERPKLAEWKTDAGIELRLESFSYYAYPTRIFFNASYGFKRFDRFVRTRNETISYGREWRFYFGILFGFDFE
ncbi:MAG: BamA/TamA family outer membrane protein [Bacteroidota bacterium]